MSERQTMTIEGDWYAGTIPNNVQIDPTAYVETSFSFYFFKSRAPKAVVIEEGASTYLGTMFDVGPKGRVRLGKFVLSHGAWFVCDDEIEVGDHTLISWNVTIMDNYRLSSVAGERRRELEQLSLRTERRIRPQTSARPVKIGANVWLGFDVCILPGVTIGEGAVVGARSVVAEDVPAYAIVGGNPARVIRFLAEAERNAAEGPR